MCVACAGDASKLTSTQLTECNTCIADLKPGKEGDAWSCEACELHRFAPARRFGLQVQRSLHYDDRVHLTPVACCRCQRQGEVWLL